MDIYIQQLSAQYFDYGGKLVQMSMRPVQLWEMVFPKTALPTVLKTIGWTGSQRKDIAPHVFALRKMLMCKKIPKMDLTKVMPRPVMSQFCCMYPIGVKADKLWTKGDFKGLEQL